jgi:hypothetical protein
MPVRPLSLFRTAQLNVAGRYSTAKHLFLFPLYEQTFGQAREQDKFF